MQMQNRCVLATLLFSFPLLCIVHSLPASADTTEILFEPLPTCEHNCIRSALLNINNGDVCPLTLTSCFCSATWDLVLTELESSCSKAKLPSDCETTDRNTRSNWRDFACAKGWELKTPFHVAQSSTIAPGRSRDLLHPDAGLNGEDFCECSGRNDNGTYTCLCDMAITSGDADMKGQAEEQTKDSKIPARGAKTCDCKWNEWVELDCECVFNMEQSKAGEPKDNPNESSSEDSGSLPTDDDVKNGKSTDEDIGENSDRPQITDGELAGIIIGCIVGVFTIIAALQGFGLLPGNFAHSIHRECRAFFRSRNSQKDAAGGADCSTELSSIRQKHSS